MATDSGVKNFNKMLFSIKESKSVSKDKMIQLTKQAMSCIKHFKHVVFSAEKFIAKCDSKFKVAGFYVIDSIVRQGIKQFKEKDVFGPRFAKNLLTTLENAMAECSEEDKLKIVRLLNLWRTHSVFPSDVTEVLLNYCEKQQLDVDIESVEVKVKGKNANMDIYAKKKKATPRTPPDRNLDESFTSQASHETLSDVAPPNGLSERELLAHLQNQFPQWSSTFEKDSKAFQKFCDLFNEQLKDRVIRERAADGANISSILCQSFEYSDDEDQEEKKPAKDPNEPLPHEKIESLAHEVFADAEFRNQLEILHSDLCAPPPPTSSSNFFAAGSQPPANPWLNAGGAKTSRFSNPFASFPDQVPSADYSTNGNAENRDSDSKNRKRGRSRSPSRSSDPRRRKSHRSRRSRSSSESEREKERRRLGLPANPRRDHLILASRTLWLGRLPQICTEQEIRDAVREFGPSPERIHIIATRATAYVTCSRRDAFKIMDRYRKEIRVSGRTVKVDWAYGSGFSKGDPLLEYWNSERGFSEIPYSKLPSDLSKIIEGGHLDVSTLPPELRGKYHETGPVPSSQQQTEKSKSREVPLSLIPTPGQLPTDLPPLPFPQQPPAMPDSATAINAQISIPGLPGGLPPMSLPGGGLIDPAVFVAVLARQQQQQQFNNLLSAFQTQAAASGLLPTPTANAAPPGIFDPTAQLGGEATPDQLPNPVVPPSFDGQSRGGFGFRGPPRGTFFGGPRFNGPPRGGEFRARGAFRGAVRPPFHRPQFPMSVNPNSFTIPPPAFDEGGQMDMDESQ